jgi:NAD(P)-dependent dehydrogenase (short-subunit alcohol dehydrogenase family)
VKSVLVTGSNGGIGTAICLLLKEHGYFVIGTDRTPDKNKLDGFIQFDIRDLVLLEIRRSEFFNLFTLLVGDTKFTALINNAAVQILGSLATLNIDDFIETIDTNLTSPLVLSKLVFESLKENKGSIVNIGSIHAKLTKPAFISYATSKAAILGLTQAMAVDSGEHIRVNAIQPAATATEMLLAGFKDTPEALENLKAFHPSNSIANPTEIAEAVSFIISDKCQFMNGTVLDINGGIGSRLHDPV